MNSWLGQRLKSFLLFPVFTVVSCLIFERADGRSTLLAREVSKQVQVLSEKLAHAEASLRWQHVKLRWLLAFSCLALLFSKGCCVQALLAEERQRSLQEELQARGLCRRSETLLGACFK